MASLRGKVALILDGAGRDGRKLAISLARQGVDIILVYQRSQAELARETGLRIQAEGRRWMSIEVPASPGGSITESVYRSIATLGRLDLFIDLSDPVEHSAQLEREPARQDHAGPLANMDIVSAAFEQMVGLT